MDRGQVEIAAFLDTNIQAIILQVRAMLAAGEKRSTYDDYQMVSFPTTWWDGFKERFFPRWLLVRYPAERTHVKIAQKITNYQNVCPHIPVDSRGRTACFRFLVPDHPAAEAFRSHHGG